MREVTPENAAEYLHESGRIAPGREVRAQALGWGVSNVVLRVDVDGEPPLVLKQARERLRTKMLWVSRLERVWTERDAMDLLGSLLPEGAVPRVVFADEPNYLFAMTCAPDDSTVWKEQLLAGRLDPAVARRAGEILGTVHRATQGHPGLTGRLADTTVFDELRVDPFYRTIARAHPEIAPTVDALIASMPAWPSPCLVLADFSPKNILVHSQGLTLVDFETAHAGDPAFDLGFFLSHLLLKGLRWSAGREVPAEWPVSTEYEEVTTRPFVEAYRAAAGPYAALLAGFAGARPGEASPVQVRRHLGACVLARVDGKSPVDYLDEPRREAARGLGLRLLA